MKRSKGDMKSWPTCKLLFVFACESLQQLNGFQVHLPIGEVSANCHFHDHWACCVHESRSFELFGCLAGFHEFSIAQRLIALAPIF